MDFGDSAIRMWIFWVTQMTKEAQIAEMVALELS